MQLNLFSKLIFRYHRILWCILSSGSLSAQQTPYTDGKDGWNADLLGNHRAVLTFIGKEHVAKATIVWRRRDQHPEQKKILVVDATSGKTILNVKTVDINRERGTIYFEPTSGQGIYYVYYMPYLDEGPNVYYPKGLYAKPENTAGEKWLATIDTTSKMLVNTSVNEIQSINAFNSFYPMEVIATEAETKSLIEKNKRKSFLVFPENRENAIRMRDDLPQRWIINGNQHNFSGTAKGGEYFTFQIGIYALENLNDVKLAFSDFKNDKGEAINSSYLSCLNLEGTRYDATPYRSHLDIAKGKVQALWCAFDVPERARPGVYQGTATVQGDGKTEKISIQIQITEELTRNGGIDEPEKMTRLKWLNSTLAQDNGVIAPYTSLVVEGNVISLLGRKLVLGENGFPQQIQTFFTPEMTSITTTPTDILTQPMKFRFYDKQGNELIQWKVEPVKFIDKKPGTVIWESSSGSPQLEMKVNASLEFDGFLAYTVKLTALQDVEFSDINFSLPLQASAAEYMMGLGLKGGYRPDTLRWKWDVAHKNQDGAWIGKVNAGFQFSLRDERYSRPLNTNFYLQKPLLLPSSWGNENRGGIDITKGSETVLVKAYSGTRRMKKGEILYYNFNLLITPFHPINTDFQWGSRFFHRYAGVDSIGKTGATTINIHHATPINPYINYPFIEYKKMKTYVDQAHSRGLKVKIYNTIRELSNKAYEIHALRSFGHEIFSGGKGKGFSWLQEHLGDDYIAAWFVPELKDAAIVNSGMNRWHNYYVEGMNWLVQNVGIDGIYLDDVAFDRITMKRIKRVLTQDGHPGILDLHSANQYNKNDGFNNSANLYMEHFPYLNKLWFGEYFDYEKSGPDFFLTEVSGIPFGLMGEMLQDGGNAWRGMIYGMTNRMPWSEKADPRPLWKLWDDFGMKESEMIGYWSESCPVRTSNSHVLATVYKKKKATLISIASWASEDVQVKLRIDWQKLGIDPTTASLVAPEIKNFQEGRIVAINEELPIAKGKGWLLIVK